MEGRRLTNEPQRGESGLGSPHARTRRRAIVATWFYEQDAKEGGAYAQVRGDSSSEAFRDVYRRCIAVFFFTARAANPDADLALVLNRPWRAEASPVAKDVRTMLELLRVTLHVRPYSFSPPSDWPAAWRNQFFVFDALEALVSAAAPDDLIMLLDSDVVWSNSERTPRLWSRLAETASLTVHIDYPPDRRVNGMTRSEMTQLARSLGLGTGRSTTLPYCGGELVGLSGDAAHRVCARAREVWPGILAHHARSTVPGMEEAHLLSMLYADLGLPTGNAASFIKRLWTQPLRFQNTAPGDEDLALWHVPAEKRYGLRRLYEALARRRHDESLGSPSVLGSYVGVPKNTRVKVVRDVTRASTSRVRARIASAARQRRSDRNV